MRLRMAEEDQQRYGGPEDLDFAAVPGWLDGLGYDDLVAVEDQIRDDLQGAKLVPPGEEVTLLWVLDQLISHTRLSSRLPLVRVRLWLSLRAAGVDLPLADFRPARLWGLKVVRPDGGAVPPAGEPDSSPTSLPESGETMTTSTSESSTDASTPGPGEPTA